MSGYSPFYVNKLRKEISNLKADHRKIDNINTFYRRWKGKYAEIGMDASELTEEKFFEWIADHIDHIN